MNRGILYVATGSRHLAEAVESAKSAKKHMPEIPVWLYCDKAPSDPHSFDEIRLVENPRHFFIDKIEPMKNSPFEQTLFLDTDTRVCLPITDLFDVLDRFDVAIAHAPMRHDRSYPVPNCFAEPNSGVIAYRKNPRVADMFDRWIAIYEEDLRTSPKPEMVDQVHLRRALYESEVSLYILPSEYNFRSVMVGFCARQRVRILHGRGDMAAVETAVNRSTAMRAVFPTLDQFNLRQVVFLDGPGRAFVGIFGRLIDCVATVFGAFRRLTGKKS